MSNQKKSNAKSKYPDGNIKINLAYSLGYQSDYSTAGSDALNPGRHAAGGAATPRRQGKAVRADGLPLRVGVRNVNRHAMTALTSFQRAS